MANGLASKLLSACDTIADKESLNLFSLEVMQELLRFGSGTPDNLNCSNHIEYGRIDTQDIKYGNVYGLKVKGKNISISNVMNIVENLELPDEIKEHFPDLTNDEWDGITRIITMVMISLECEKQQPH